MSTLDKKRKEKRILHYTPGRSGSTFISQILYSLFERKNVWAGHEPITFKKGAHQNVIITIRDFRDVMVSYWRTGKDIPLQELEKGKKMTKQEVLHSSVQICNIINGALTKTYNANPGALILRYEEFFPNKFDFILDSIGNHCKIEITDQQKDFIKNNFNFDKNKQRSDAAGSFKNVDKNSVHGKHVYKGTIGGWKELVPNHLHSLVNQKMKDVLIKWDYKI